MADPLGADLARILIISTLAEALAVEGVVLPPEQGLRIVDRLVDELAAHHLLAASDG